MATFLFDSTVFGPVQSRRLGVSLGINLLPNDRKLCSFDCIYCECGWNPEASSTKTLLPSVHNVESELIKKLEQMAATGKLPDVITFAGNGEPTMHPSFHEIIDLTIALRDRFAPKARVAVLSNSTMLHKLSVVEALKKVDDNILKLDAGNEETIARLNLPNRKVDIEKLTQQLASFQGEVIIQTMFLQGKIDGNTIDNTTEEEILSWMNLLEKIAPKKIMIYTIARDTPATDLQKIDQEKLHSIAKRVMDSLHIPVEVSA